MTAEITTVIGQLSIVEGNWHGDTPNQVAVREPKAAGAPGAGKGDLFVLVEVRGAESEYTGLEQKLAEVIRDTYYLDRGSVTASLRRALQSAGDQLYGRNNRVSLEERVVAGVVALVMSQEDAFVAQIGPAALFAVLGDHIQRYPTQSVWLDEALPPTSKDGKKGAEEDNESALGLRPVVEPNLHHLRVGPQDVLVLADSGLAGQLPLTEVVKAVDSAQMKTIIKNLGQAAQASNCSALAVMVVEETPATLGSFLKRGLPQREPAPAAEPRLAAAGMPVNESTPEKSGVSQPLAMAGLLIQQPMQWLDRLVKHRRDTEVQSEETPDAVAEAKIPAASPSPPTRRRTAPDRGVNEPSARMAAETKVMASVAHGSNFEPELRHPRSVGETVSMGVIFRWLGVIILLPIALLGRGVHALLGSISRDADSQGPRVAGRQAHHHQPAPVSWKLLRNIAIAIPLVVALIVAVIYWQKGRIREAEYTEFLTGAQNKFQQAQSADAPTALGLMGEAEKLLVEAEKIKSGQPEIADLRQKMAEQTDVSGKVQRLYYLPQLRQYTDSGTNLKSIIVQGVEVYVLDAGTDRIFHHRMNDVGEALLPDDESLLVASRGQAVDKTNVAELMAMTWMPAGGNRQTSDLLILNSNGLLEYNPSWGITSSALSIPDNVVVPTAVDSFFGNFYVLDPPANMLWRYLPTADGYSTPPQSYFPADQPVDLTGAVDLAIDGAVYILYKDGRISKFEGGKTVSFNVTGLDKPLSNPAAIFTAPNESVQHLYVADTGNQRIVQLSKDGSFIHQFKPREGEGGSFANLQDIYVDEIGGRLYLLDSNNLYVGNIPEK